MKLNKKGYIDPSTGMVVWNTVWPFVVSICAVIAAFVVRYFWRPIKKFFKRET